MSRERKTDLEVLEVQQKLLDDYNKRRGEGFFQDVVFVRRGSTRSKPDVFTKRESYSFLQYLRPVMHWAKRNSNITRPMIDLLLYIHPLGIFRKADFVLFSRVIDIYHLKMFSRLMEGGWIKEWRAAKPNKGQSALYCLTPKAEKLCTRIHKMCLGEEKIPESSVNSLTQSDRPIDKYYMNIIKKMNEANGFK